MRISDWSSDVCSSDLPLARSICVAVSTRSVAVTPSISLSVSLNPTTSGISIDTGWPSIAATASIPPTPPPRTPCPLLIVVLLTVPTDGKHLVEGQSVLVRGDLGGQRTLTK